MTFRGQIKISHLLFANDFFSLRRRLRSAKILKLFYKIFVLAQAKSLVHKNHASGFHQIQPGVLKNRLLIFFYIPTTTPISTYLGTPSFTTCQKANAYQYLIDKIQKKIEGWQVK